MYYAALRDKRYDKDRKDVVGSLLRLREGLQTLPARKNDHVSIATWNIREFGGSRDGGRMEEALYCIAEIINHFDLIAVQEVRADLHALERVMTILGRDWDRIFTDVSYAKSGNHERLAFLWDRRKVQFTGLAGELVLPETQSKTVAQIARTPFICGFQSGWAKFNLCTVHIYYGESAPDDPRRIGEIYEIGNLLAKKAKDYIKTKKPEEAAYSPENLVLLGDFNIFSKDDNTYDALRKTGFVLPEGLAKDEIGGSNVAKDKFYDQIVFYEEVRNLKNTAAGVFDYYRYIFRDEDENRFRTNKQLPAGASFKTWRTYQMSDHLVMWAEFAVDKTDDYLKELAALVNTP